MSEQRKPAEEYVVIRHRPGYRVKRAVILAVFTLAAAAAGYAAGLAQGGFRFTSAEASNEQLEVKVAALESNYREARQQLVNLERGKLIDEQALNQARKIIVDLETRVGDLKSDLTFYKNIMAPSETSKGLQVDRFTLASDRQAGAYNFKLVLTQVGNNKSYISGLVAVNIIGMRDDEKEVIALRDLSQEIEDLGVKFRFRYFQDVEGKLALPDDFEPLEVQVVAQAEGRKSSQAERTFDWDDLTEN
ncbi:MULTISPECIES: DUF6776 family protein [unclassified Marinobacter]|uniref:DUF6776 family protein n=1 Tax=unclassified Marinobacter TaxID=83889 RepID=UPI0026E43577|nr:MULTISPECIES: DUF6776 family protein [unclassified Marinobacter]MDO6444104.1 hypothetical protein [Marinobacter sp. 2_MG-2023]MDO6823985.1 hypothetical protein [Marinobacter sp. 1_MG-2023]